jgi:putative glutamine amidotransferase
MTGVTGTTVNSLHSQGVNTLGSELEVVAMAEDGLIEAFSVIDAPGFTLGVQWHPEWKPMESEVSMAIFRNFGDACREYRLRELRR